MLTGGGKKEVLEAKYKNNILFSVEIVVYQNIFITQTHHKSINLCFKYHDGFYQCFSTIICARLMSRDFLQYSQKL